MGNVIYLADRGQPADVLLVEREPLMRLRTAAHLRRAGLSVMEAVDAAEVLTLLRAGRMVRVVVGDIDCALADRLRADFPQLGVVVGIADETSPFPHGRLSAVRRPYDPKQVERTIKALLAGLHFRI